MTTPASDTARGTSLAGIVGVVRRRFALALVPFLFVLTGVASLTLFLPSLWTATAQILVDRPQIPETMVKSTVSSDLASRLLTLSQEILSSSRLRDIVQQYGLYPRLRASQPVEAIAERMRREIRIDVRDERPRTSGAGPASVAFDISYTAADPRLAAAVTNTLASLYIAENSKLREQQAAGTSSFLEAQLRDVRARLTDQEQRIAAYKERHLGELPEQREANLRMMEQLQARLAFAQENNRRANERRQAMTKALAETDPGPGTATGASGPNPSPAQTAAARANLLRQELAQLQTRYSDRYPDIIALKEQIRALEAKAAEPAPTPAPTPAPRRGRPDLRLPPENPYLQSLMQQLDQANVEAKASGEEIAYITRQVAVYNRRLENTPKREQELALIARDYETTKQLFQSLLAKRGEADIAADLEQRQKSERFRILAGAAVPSSPAGPNRLRLLLVGLLAAVGASGLAALLAENLDTSYRRLDEVRMALPVPVLSVIPSITTERDRQRRTRRRRLAAAAVAVGLLAVVGSTFTIAHDNHAIVSQLMGEPGGQR